MEFAAVSVKDAFEIKANTPGSSHAPGVVVIFDGRQCAFRVPRAGSEVVLLRPDGVHRGAVIGELKEHGEGRSFFFEGLHREDAPIGTIVSWLQMVAETPDDAERDAQLAGRR